MRLLAITSALMALVVVAASYAILTTTAPASAQPAPPQLTVEKVCIPDPDDGSTFNITIAGGVAPEVSEIQCGDELTYDLEWGVNYTLSESSIPNGWLDNEVISGFCSSTGAFTFVQGVTNPEQTCIITNTPDVPTVQLQKLCDPADLVGEFTIALYDGNQFIAAYDLECGETSPPIIIDLDVEYTVVENLTNLPLPTFGGLCSSNGAGGGEFTIPDDAEVITGICTVTNRPPTVTIRKLCDPLTNDIFTINVTPQGVDTPLHTVDIGCNGTTGELPVLPNVTYVVTEAPKTGWTVDEFELDCAPNGVFILGNGDISDSCIIHNKRQPTPTPTPTPTRTPTPTPTPTSTPTPTPTPTPTATSTPTPTTTATSTPTTVTTATPTSTSTTVSSTPRVTPIPPKTGAGGIDESASVPWMLLTALALGVPAVLLLRRRA